MHNAICWGHKQVILNKIMNYMTSLIQDQLSVTQTKAVYLSEGAKNTRFYFYEQVTFIEYFNWSIMI